MSTAARACKIVLSATQHRIWTFMINYQAWYGIAPTLREIGEELEFAGPSGVTCHMRVLVKKGWVRPVVRAGKNYYVAIKANVVEVVRTALAGGPSASSDSVRRPRPPRNRTPEQKAKMAATSKAWREAKRASRKAVAK